MADFGHDLSANDDVDAGMREVEGLELLGEDVRWRLSTRRGLLLEDPNYGIDLRDFLSAEMTADQLAQIPSQIDAELTKDDRIDSTETTAVWDPVASKLTLTIVLQTAAGPFPLTFVVTADTIEFITGGGS